MPGRGSGNYDRHSSNPRSQEDKNFSSEGINNLEDFFSTMFKDTRSEDQKRLQNARVISFLSGVPYVGNFIQGIDRARQVEDLYNNTGRVPEYPALSGGYGQLGHAVGSAALGGASKIANGFNDLYQYYTGEVDAFHQSSMTYY